MDASTTTADRIRPWVVLIALPVTIAAAALGSGFFGGTEVEASSSGALSDSATPLAPYGPAFSIWSLIYLGLAAYAVWQLLPRQRHDPRQRLLGWLAVASLVLNASWILCAQAGLLPVTVVVILLLLAVLLAIFEVLRRSRPASLVETVVVDGTFGLYLGWVAVATVANIAAFLADAGVRPTDWELPTILVLLLVAVVAALLAVRGAGRIAPALAMLWGVAWIGVGRAIGEPASATVAIAAAVVCVLIGFVTVAARLRAPAPARVAPAGRRQVAP
ncbi:tryptophan-rich sensory protein [Agrococcus jenensis]|uniref:TspO/MBR related protein n=1 Tax=Agrococcus jenensis TaxID=46353 RepID=A0A3N2API3_9MICO|nr:tryptophan-rich sensory protein [Agrococcus jenensis]ROR64960.1 TspO/MBR related protein [Agrococcus jenensis]